MTLTYPYISLTSMAEKGLRRDRLYITLTRNFAARRPPLVDIAKRARRTPYRWDPVFNHIKEPSNLFFYRSLIPAASSILQIVLLIYFLNN